MYTFTTHVTRKYLTVDKDSHSYGRSRHFYRANVCKKKRKSMGEPVMLRSHARNNKKQKKEERNKKLDSDSCDLDMKSKIGLVNKV